MYDILNRIRERIPGPVPVVGMGCTELAWSDRKAHTVVAILNRRKTKVAVTRDAVRRNNGLGPSVHQNYTYFPQFVGPRIILKQNKQGQWKEAGRLHGSIFIMGKKEEYWDLYA